MDYHHHTGKYTVRGTLKIPLHAYGHFFLYSDRLRQCMFIKRENYLEKKKKRYEQDKINRIESVG